MAHDVLEPAADRVAMPELAPGTELLGEYLDSAYEEPRYLVRRADGRVLQLPRLLYRVAESLDGREVAGAAADLGAELGRELTAEQLVYLVDDRLRPAGIVAGDRTRPGADAAASAPRAPLDPLLALRYRVGVVPASVAWHIAGFFRPLFARPVWVTLVAAFVALDVWIIAQGAVLDRFVAGVRQIALQPVLVLAVLGLSVVFTAFHESGHVTACRYGGARPGDLGVGLYIVWPAFYSTVTDSYRLGRTGRLRTDLGGIYFNTVFLLGAGLLYLGTGQPWLLVALAAMHVQTLWQFLPNLRLDGYYILADLVGVPELFGFVRPALASLLPGRPPHPRLRGLKPRARRVIICWVALVVPTLLLWLFVFLLAMPRLVPAAWQASLEYLQRLEASARAGDVVATTLGISQLLLLALPWVGLALVIWSLGGLLARRSAGRWAGRVGAPRRLALRRGAGYLALGALGCALVVRVARVAASLPATPAEGRLVDGAIAGLQHAGDTSPGAADWAVSLQLLGYARLTGAFDRHDSAVAGARELAVLATVVLVTALLALTLGGRVPPLAAALSLFGALVMGPAVVVLATLDGGLVATAWTAVGLLVLVYAQGRAAAVPGVAAIALGVLSEPLIAVPLAAGIGVVLVVGTNSPEPPPRHAAGRRHVRTRPAADDSRRWLATLLVLPPAVLTTSVWGASADHPVATPGRTVLLLLVSLLIAAALPTRRLWAPATAAGVVAALAFLPWARAAEVLPMALTALALLAALLVNAWTRGPVADRPHPMLRVAVAVPALVLVLSGGLLVPAAGPAQPHRALASWIDGSPSASGVVAVPAGLWGDLIRDGIPEARLVRTGTAAAAGADWAVSVGPGPAPVLPEAAFGSGPTVLTVYSLNAVRDGAFRIVAPNVMIP